MHKDLRNLWLPYTQMKDVKKVPRVSKTNKCKIYLSDGITLIDGVSSWWTACHGYNNNYIKKKVYEQLNRMPHIMFGGLIHDQAIKLSKRLAILLNNKLKKVFFCDSGSVSIEVALKMAIQFWLNQGYKNKNKFIFFQNGYHGDTSGAMSICDPKEGMHSLFGTYLNKNFLQKIPESKSDQIKFTKFLEKHKTKIAAIIIEPLMQGAGGMKFNSKSALNFLYKIKKKYKLLLIYDEIATGFYRTGTMFAFQQTKTIPDIICLGKALTGGVISLAATISSEKIFNAFLSHNEDKELMHGPTYMANPLACSAANASLDLFEKKDYSLIIKKIEKTLREELVKFNSFSFVKEIRVLGATGVIELFTLSEERKIWLKNKFIKKGIWIRPFRNIIYFMPPFVISKKELLILVSSTYDVLKSWEKENEK